MLRFNEIAGLFRCSLKSPTRPFPYWRYKKHKDRILKRNDFSASIKGGLCTGACGSIARLISHTQGVPIRKRFVVSQTYARPQVQRFPFRTAPSSKKHDHDRTMPRA